ncbi:hypothetical protein PVIIG_06057 [Plasmodium vivax India VII]|uniref:Uncharacterized protein n=1 Tax=Plasmodium vivax India VII TaxID=1077284 RepID=A0A0J9UUT2_PLAVI|nr:hypothetical protein PVIIG_06057 [Plasmodium vivax India VII]
MNSLWSTLDSDLCNFLYFWLGNILLEKLNANFLFHEVILYLFDTLIDDKYQKICKLPHSLMLKKDFENFKLIFDCSQGYKSYSKHLLSPGMSCSNKYKSYLDTDTNNYKRFYNECEKKAIWKHKHKHEDDKSSEDYKEKKNFLWYSLYYNI